MVSESENLRYVAHENYNSGQYWKAVEECIKAITLSPALQWPYLLMGKCYIKCNRGREGLALVKRFLDLNPDPYSEYTDEAKALVESMEGTQ